MAAENATNQDVLNKFAQLYGELFSHDGYADMRVEMKILRRGQKEIIIHCGRQYRYIVDFKNDVERASEDAIAMRA
ncbi:MAG: hypothetical protein MI754_18370 [Chromatiales bacterium]|nr:hypothetical protein [Chromatiales bacterium]